MNSDRSWMQWVRKYKIAAVFLALACVAAIILAVAGSKRSGVAAVDTLPEKSSGDSTPAIAAAPDVAAPKFSREDMVWVPEGTFMMGSEKGDNDEKPIHQVTVDGFYISRTEVTQKDFELVMGVNPSNFKDCPTCPVEKVSWFDAILYCNARTKAAGSQDTVYRYTSKTGKPGMDLVLEEIGSDLRKKGFRLPTEAEWEYACRAGGSTKYFWGNSMDEGYVWDQTNSGQKTHPVGRKKPNGFGLFDMNGNVWEWCNDWYGTNYEGNIGIQNPQGPASGMYRVFRGGSWLNDDVNFRSTIRKASSPSVRDFNIGFRCVISR